VELSGVESAGSGTYDAGFSRARGDTASATFSATGGGTTDPSLESSTVTDNSETTGPPFNRQAQYDVAYSVFDPDNRFDRVEVTFDSPEVAPETETNFAESGSVSYTGPDGSSGDEYTIEIRVYDVSGSVVDSQTITDTADNTDP
jgi:hypothetical protein